MLDKASRYRQTVFRTNRIGRHSISLRSRTANSQVAVSPRRALTATSAEIDPDHQSRAIAKP